MRQLSNYSVSSETNEISCSIQLYFGYEKLVKIYAHYKYFVHPIVVFINETKIISQVTEAIIVQYKFLYR